MNQDKEAEQPVTRDDVLTAIVAGDRTKRQLADRFGIELHPVYGSPALSHLLDALVCADLLCMEVVNADWHYKPTKAGRAQAAQQAITAITDRRRLNAQPA